MAVCVEERVRYMMHHRGSFYTVLRIRETSLHSFIVSLMDNGGSFMWGDGKAENGRTINLMAQVILLAFGATGSHTETRRLFSVYFLLWFYQNTFICMENIDSTGLNKET